jgi:hypothetical protein
MLSRAVASVARSAGSVARPLSQPLHGMVWAMSNKAVRPLSNSTSAPTPVTSAQAPAAIGPYSQVIHGHSCSSPFSGSYSQR